ncbi:MAG: type II toxin-antitoxin system RatA family toxin [Magnetovibrio sp.]|nr:type II toxin-antitoxin system RatA family toxin [Magnetovibrio sp.]
MPSYSETQNLTFTPRQMFDLVLDVEQYPDFLPWCVALRVRKRGETEMFADMAVGFKMLRERYSSHITWNDMDDGGHHMHIQDAGGPFKYLETDWTFHPHGDGCTVDFRIDFEFSSMLLEKVMGKVFTQAAHKMMQAFVSRAKDIY